MSVNIINNILSRCWKLLYENIQNNEINFQLLDPLIMDSQCHLHAVSLLETLIQVNNYKSISLDSRFITELNKKILSCAILFSLLKYDVKDKLGFVVHSSLIKMTSKELSGKKLNKLRAEFNHNSVNNFKNFATGNIKHIIEQCNATILYSDNQLYTIPTYASIYLTIKYLETRNLPIIVSLYRLIKENGINEDKFLLHSVEVLYFKYSSENKMYNFVEGTYLSDSEKQEPTIHFSCLSRISSKDYDQYQEFIHGTQFPSKKFLTEICDIRDMILLAAAGHIQLLKKCVHWPSKNSINENYVEKLFKSYSNELFQPNHSFRGNFNLVDKNIYGCYMVHREMAKKFGMENARYLSLNYNSSVIEDVYKIERMDKNTLFCIDHIHISNYLNELNNLVNIDFETKIPKNEIARLDHNQVKETFINCVLEKISKNNK